MVRQSTSAADDSKCLDPITKCSFKTQNKIQVVVPYSPNAQQPLPSNSRIGVMLANCFFQTCVLMQSGCTAPLDPASRLSVQGAAPTFSITVSDTNTEHHWSETVCLKCTSASSTETTEIHNLQVLKTELLGTCNWRPVRYLPPLATAWYPVDDNMQGTSDFGVYQVNTASWGVRFFEFVFDEIMFMTNNLEHYTIIPKSTLIPPQFMNAL